MALARCRECGSPQGLKHEYPHIHSSARGQILCGASTCAAPAFVWLTDEEERHYLRGQRSFQISNHGKHVTIL